VDWLCEQTTKTGGVLLITGWFCDKEILQYFSLGSPPAWCCCFKLAATLFQENSRIIVADTPFAAHFWLPGLLLIRRPDLRAVPCEFEYLINFLRHHGRRVWSKCGPEFGAQEGAIVTLQRALYGLKTASRSFYEFFGDTYKEWVSHQQERTRIYGTGKQMIMQATESR
jgi:hypothetical protein